MNNWYDTYNNKLQKEAGTKEALASLLFLIGTAWYGGSIAEKLKSLPNTNISPQEIESTVNQINQSNKTLDQMTKEDAETAISNSNATETTEEISNTTEPQPPSAKKKWKEVRPDLSNLSDEEVIARTIYDEARGEDNLGMAAVARTILNRSDNTPESMRYVCLKPKQFSGWNNNTVLPMGKGGKWETSKRYAEFILKSKIEPDSNGYKYFCNPRTILRLKGMSVPAINNAEDIVNIPDTYLRYLPSFMFNPKKVQLGGGRWKHVYPKNKNNLRADFNIIGNHVFYP